jgi:hypothetical protein
MLSTDGFHTSNPGMTEEAECMIHFLFISYLLLQFSFTNSGTLHWDSRHLPFYHGSYFTLEQEIELLIQILRRHI